MNAKGRFDPEQLLADARSGRTDSLGRVLEFCRTDLALLARAQIDLKLQGRVDASDLVQETFLDACRDFRHFRGTSHRDWVAWLRKILFYNLARVVQRQIAAKKRSTRREMSLNQRVAAMDLSSGTNEIETALVSRWCSPSSQARRREGNACLADQLARLPRCSIELKPDFAHAHYKLGNYLDDAERPDEAESAYRKAIALRPGHAESHCDLGMALWKQGKLAPALASLERGHDLGSARKDWRYPSAEWVRECREKLEQVDRPR
jgi:RNA polymerase sigma-70 factor (ECF subfamily)